jgi:arylsulfatase A-like enzyme
LPAEAATIAAKAQGYATGHVVKNHFGAAEGCARYRHGAEQPKPP